MIVENKYKNLSQDELQKVYSNYLMDSWSFSKISEFSRNEKSFEMSYVYGIKQKSAATTVAGSAYHHALDLYFDSLKKGDLLDFTFLEMVAFEYIESQNANFWKIQKTTPTVTDCIAKANETTSKLLKNFLSEISTYTDNLKEVLFVEVYLNEFLTINGVDIPLPCHAKIDLVIKTKDDKIVIIDHKSKNAFSNEQEMKLSIGRQAITYVNCFESANNVKVDEVWFVENKYSANKDKSPQLNCFKVSITNDTRKLYEALLYEPLKKMLTAISDPDYVYMINDSDNFIDKAELYEFWAKTMIAEVEEFNVLPSKKELVSKRLKKIRDASIISASPTIIKEFKRNASEFIQYDLSNKNMTQQEKIEHVLRSFGVIAKVAHMFDGYSSNTYLLEVSAGVKIASIHSHKLDISNVLDVSSVRMSKDLMVYEGKSYISIEALKKRDKDLIFDAKYLSGYKIPIGVDNFSRTIFWDLENHSTPHMLICGATGSGKSVSIKSTIEYAKLAGIKDIIILDPKYEFTKYNSGNIKVYNDIEDIEKAMENLVEQMNLMVKDGITKKTLVVFDEFADAVSSSKKGNELDIKEMVQTGTRKVGSGILAQIVPKMELKKVGEKKSLEENLRVLLQKGRSCGFRILSATQRASVKVINGDAKVNFPVQVCFRVPKEVDSKVVIDESGAESLAGAGDGLIKSPEYQDVVRFQAFYTK